MGGLRVTGGLYKGRIVEVPRGDLEIRPAMDRMRESVFSILGNLSGMSFLDLFSGSGIIALEASSRGASPVVCIERDRAKLKTLIRNVSISKDRIECHALPVERFVLRCERQFSIVFCDPPFPYEHRAALIASIAEKRLLEEGGFLLMHFPRGDVLPDRSLDLELSDERVYGGSYVRIYRRLRAADASGPGA